MTPDQLQPVIDSLTAEANRCVLDGELELEPERVGVPDGVFGRFMSKSGR